MAPGIRPFLLCTLFTALQLGKSTSQNVVKAGYWFRYSGMVASSINSKLFTHLICAFADLNNETYEVSISSTNHDPFSTFTQLVQQKNPSVKTLLSIGGGNANATSFALMASENSSRKSFIDSSINLARSYNFHGLDLDWQYPSDTEQMTNFGHLVTEWKDAVIAEANSSGKAQLLLSSAVLYLAYYHSTSVPYPIQAISNSLDWINVMAYDFYGPLWTNSSTGPPAALYNPGRVESGDNGVNSWIQSGLSVKKIVLGLPFYGWAWHLINAKNNGFFAPANATGLPGDGSILYSQIIQFLTHCNVTKVFNSTFVGDYVYNETIWIGYDDTESISTKASYAKEKGLLGYYVWHVGADDNWVLSTKAEAEFSGGNQSGLLLKIVLPIASIFVLSISALACYYRWCVTKRKRRSGPGNTNLSNMGTNSSSPDKLGGQIPSLQVFSFVDIKSATNNFSDENKLGRGGFGPVYKGKLPSGREIAVKRLSSSSTQGQEEFRNEVLLAARLQHFNLALVLGYCTEMEEKMLIYEFMPNRSLDQYLFDVVRRNILDWNRRVRIVEGIVQGLLYLQEYSNFTIIHRDLKASNILLDKEMNPKISDFGIARLFGKDVFEENTRKIVGTYGYVPPEYVTKGRYSTKYDVYSFGVLLLQIISGKRNGCHYGPNGNLRLLEYAYESWKNRGGKEFYDQLLDDSSSRCKLDRCLEVALLCVQENPEDRPTMLEVFTKLKSDANDRTNVVPQRPAFSVNEEQISIVPPEIYSFNDPQISDLEPR